MRRQRLSHSFRTSQDGNESTVQRSWQPMAWLDIPSARSWLNRHADTVAVLDCDRGLGEAMMTKNWMHKEVSKQLGLDVGSFQRRASDQKAAPACLIATFTVPHVLSIQEQCFCSADSTKNMQEIFASMPKFSPRKASR